MDWVFKRTAQSVTIQARNLRGRVKGAIRPILLNRKGTE